MSTLTGQAIKNTYEGLLKLENTKGKSAQVGYDLSLKAVNKIGTRIGGPFSWSGTGEIGYVLKDRTILNTYTPVETLKHHPKGSEDYIDGWMLEIGTYDLVFNEGCKILNNRVAFIKQRSSLWRNGVLINSPIFDPGFETDNMGTTMLVTEPIFIEKDARVAQIYFHECEPAEKYNGQWQGDKQRL
jgi:deoxycytidine triphosphate deaminase